MMVLLANARAEVSKDVNEELLNKEDEEGVLTEMLENTKDASIDKTDVEEDDENTMNVILEENKQFYDPQLIRIWIGRRPF